MAELLGVILGFTSVDQSVDHGPAGRPDEAVPASPEPASTADGDMLPPAVGRNVDLRLPALRSRYLFEPIFSLSLRSCRSASAPVKISLVTVASAGCLGLN